MQQPVFNYRLAAQNSNIPQDVVYAIEREVHQEFPNDAMMAELHILRALNSRNYCAA